MKLVLFSDSHGNVANMADVVRLEHPDRVLHMGDLARDAEELARQFPDIPVTYVPGNCDGRLRICRTSGALPWRGVKS